MRSARLSVSQLKKLAFRASSSRTEGGDNIVLSIEFYYEKVYADRDTLHNRK